MLSGMREVVESLYALRDAGAISENQMTDTRKQLRCQAGWQKRRGPDLA